MCCIVVLEHLGVVVWRGRKNGLIKGCGVVREDVVVCGGVLMNQIQKVFLMYFLESEYKTQLCYGYDVAMLKGYVVDIIRETAEKRRIN